MSCVSIKQKVFVNSHERLHGVTRRATISVGTCLLIGTELNKHDSVAIQSGDIVDNVLACCEVSHYLRKNY